ncbi:hypothetical protein F442_07046 [Phytophthora nicotianae P10297]|uniref:RxLR effector protein n=3 Tax=Phytophthora nicotianae TaxID=4792 RepID=V9FF69_PHYNI|nr:hypothetical protein F443_06998 [Phytophthora nicotianae P1569]ETL95540.1 hypothetical protein L917_06688 [Phytophthora nicotianae]ETP46773.1 hypothetical protein F442_07046 [Phytophthora nicotianae P10297]
MRLLAWIFVVTIVTFLSSVSATSAVASSDETPFGHLTTKEFGTSTRLLAVDDDATAQRFLRGDAKTDLMTSTDNLAARSEERGLIPSKFTNLLRNVKGNWNTNALVAKMKGGWTKLSALYAKSKGGWAKLKGSWLERAMKHMENKGENPNQAYERLMKKSHLTKGETVLLKAYVPRYKATHPEFTPHDKVSKLLSVA